MAMDLVTGFAVESTRGWVVHIGLGVNLGMAVPYPMVALVRFLPIVAEAPVFTASFWPDSTFACFTPFEPSHGWWSRRRSGMGWAMHLLSLSLLNPLDRFTRMASAWAAVSV